MLGKSEGLHKVFWIIIDILVRGIWVNIVVFTIVLDQLYGLISQIIRHPKIIFSDFIGFKKIFTQKSILIFSLILCRSGNKLEAYRTSPVFEDAREIVLVCGTLWKHMIISRWTQCLMVNFCQVINARIKVFHENTFILRHRKLWPLSFNRFARMVRVTRYWAYLCFARRIPGMWWRVSAYT